MKYKKCVNRIKNLRKVTEAEFEIFFYKNRVSVLQFWFYYIRQLQICLGSVLTQQNVSKLFNPIFFHHITQHNLSKWRGLPQTWAKLKIFNKLVTCYITHSFLPHKALKKSVTQLDTSSFFIIRNTRRTKQVHKYFIDELIL